MDFACFLWRLISKEHLPFSSDFTDVFYCSDSNQCGVYSSPQYMYICATNFEIPSDIRPIEHKAKLFAGYVQYAGAVTGRMSITGTPDEDETYIIWFYYFGLPSIVADPGWSFSSFPRALSLLAPCSRIRKPPEARLNLFQFSLYARCVTLPFPMPNCPARVSCMHSSAASCRREAAHVWGTPDVMARFVSI